MNPLATAAHLISESTEDALFELAPVSLWLEDFADVYALLQRWRSEGVTDIEAFIRSRPAALKEYFSAIRVLKVNQRTLMLYGATDLPHLLSAVERVFDLQNLEATLAEIRPLWEGVANYQVETTNFALDGSALNIRLNVNRLPSVSRPWDRMLMAIEDLTAERNAQREASQNEAYARGLFDLSPVSLWVEDFSQVKALMDEVREQGITDFRTFMDVHPEFVFSCMERIRVIDVNQQTLRLYGASSKTHLLNRLPEVFRDEMARSFSDQLLDAWNGNLFQSRETLNYSLHGDPIHLHMQWAVLPGHERDWDLVQVALTDITARKKAEAYLAFLGKHDALTKLHNRAYFDEEIARLNRRGPFPIGVLMVDVNGLKWVNDRYGHRTGDALLRRAAEAIRKVIEPSLHPARIGGDEFSCLLPGYSAAEMAKLVDSLGMVLEMNNQFYQGPKLTLSAGYAVSQEPGGLEAALREADDVMYEGKRNFYKDNPEVDSRVRHYEVRP